MKVYYNPDIRILTMRLLILRKWHYANLKVNFWRLYWHSKPGATVRYQKQLIVLTPGRMVLVPPNIVISQRLDHGPVTHFGVHFLTDVPFNRLHARIYVFKAEAGILNEINALRPNERNFLTGNLKMIIAVHGLIYSLLSRIVSAELQPLRISVGPADNMAFIEANLHRPLSNRQIARHMSLSVSTMCRHYQRELGMSPQTYLRLKRIEKACVLLHDPQKSIKQIAEETGFCDRYHFSRTFKALQGTTPFLYQRRFG